MRKIQKVFCIASLVYSTTTTYVGNNLPWILIRGLSNQHDDHIIHNTIKPEKLQLLLVEITYCTVVSYYWS